MPKLNQIIAIEKGVKSRVYSTITEMHKTNQKPDLFHGFSKQYRKKEEFGEEYPPEEKRVQVTAQKQLEHLQESLTTLFNITATKDVGNCEAKAQVVVDGGIIVKDVPATYLIFLEKQLTDIYTFVEALPVLDSAEDWRPDVNSGLYRTEPTLTTRTKKEQRPIVLYEATVEHPAQTQLITEDQVVGHWETVRHSGAMAIPEKERILKRIEALQKAVKMAREEANSVSVEEKNFAEDILGYLFA